MKINTLTTYNINALIVFLIKNENEFFIPHNHLKETINNNILSKDKYYLMFIDDTIVGYGMLRGYEEGYKIPSLGIIIDKDYRGLGYSKILMTFLEEAASTEEIRLTVFKGNKKALSLYKNIGYEFEEYNDISLLGLKKIIKK